jgi:nucleotide-binding universal stress UspA family protein
MNGPRRVLAVLECSWSDDEVLERAVAIAGSSGGYLTLVAVVPQPVRLIAGPYIYPHPSPDVRRAEAEAAIARAVRTVPPEIPLLTEVAVGRTREVIARRVAVAAHDLVVVRRRRLRCPARSVRVPVVPVPA